MNKLKRFIEERGPSYRHCDVFDDLYAEIQSQLSAEYEQLDSEYRNRTHYYSHHYNHHASSHAANSSSDLHTGSSAAGSSAQSLIASHIRSIAQKLYKYEFPHTQLPAFVTPNVAMMMSKTANSSGKNLVSNKQSMQMLVDASSSTTTTGKDSKNALLAQPARSLSKIKLPTLDAFRRIHAETFPLLDATEISRLLSQNSITTALNKTNETNINTSSSSVPRNHLCRPHLVPYGPPIETVRLMSSVNQRLVELSDSSMNFDATHQFMNHHQYHHHNRYMYPFHYGTSTTTNGVLDPWQQCSEDNDDPTDPLGSSSSNCARKLDTISHYVASIFENNFKEAKKNLNSAYRALRDPRARLHLCACLQRYVKRNQVSICGSN